MAYDRPKIVDLFSGAGGLALGLHAAGFDTAAALDADELCGETFRENFSRLQPTAPPLVLAGPEKGDVARIDLPSLGRQLEPDVLVGGPPCQGFSRVGRAKLNSLSDEGYEDDPRNALYLRFLEAAAEWRPKAVVMENVAGMLNVKGVNIGEAAAADLARLGYEVGYAVLNAAWYGVPQYRERFFLIGIRDDLGVRPEMPVPTHLADLPSGYLRSTMHDTLPMPFLKHHQLPVRVEEAEIPAVTVSEAIGDLPPIHDHKVWITRPRGEFRRPARLDAPPASDFSNLMRDWPGLGPATEIHDHAIRHTPRDYETFRRMKPGDRYPDAWAIMNQRIEEELRRLDNTPDGAPAPGTVRYEALLKSIRAPYPVDIFPDKWRKLIPDAPSWTIPAHLAKDSYSHIHYDSNQARSISVREAARIQSFPDAFTFAGNMGDCFRQIGNAVPPILGRAIGLTLSRLLQVSRTQPD